MPLRAEHLEGEQLPVVVGHDHGPGWRAGFRLPHPQRMGAGGTRRHSLLSVMHAPMLLHMYGLLHALRASRDVTQKG